MNELKNYWKTPYREVYSVTFWQCVCSTFRCHVWLRLFPVKLPKIGE